MGARGERVGSGCRGDKPASLQMIMVDPALIDQIYECALAVERWPAVLQRIADEVGAIGGALVMRSPRVVSLVPSPRVVDVARDFVAEGWGDDEDYVAPLLREMYPGFRSETAYRSVAEIEASPVHREFWTPRGFTAGTGTVVQGANDDLLQITFEGFASHEAAERRLPQLDLLRPHLARAVALTSAIRDARSQTIVRALSLAGVSAMVVSAAGRMKAANQQWEAHAAALCDTTGGRLRFVDRFMDRRFMRALTAVASDAAVLSIAPPVQPGREPLVVHMIPLRGAAREIADTDGVLLILAGGTNVSVPGADLLRTLFDLTPAEARLARAMAEGQTPAAAAAMLGISVGTVRVHLRAIFGKTGVGRQTDLVALLGRLGG